MEQTKICTKCGEAKQMCYFYKERAKCKKCVSEEAKERYLSDPEERSRKKANSAARHQQIKGSDALKRQSARASARYRERHPDRLAAAYERDRQRNTERLRKWRKDNKEKARAQSERRRPKQLAYYKEQVERVSDYYVVHGLHLPVEVAPLKRAQIQIRRATKQLKKSIKEI